MDSKDNRDTFFPIGYNRPFLVCFAYVLYMDIFMAIPRNGNLKKKVKTMILDKIKLKVNEVLHGPNFGISQMTVEEFEALPHISAEEAGEFQSLIILPTDDVHDSGYACMDFIPCRGEKPLGRLSGYSDALHINGIGGYGPHWLEKNKGLPRQVVPIGWTMDCLPQSRLMRLFWHGPLTASDPLSSFEIFAERKDGD